MGFNSKEIKTISTAKGKGDPLKGTIYDPMGQWKYPGQITKVPGHDITMVGVGYPVLGVDDLGASQIMMPGNNYSYPGQTVTEYPMMQAGGVMMASVNSLLPTQDMSKKKAETINNLKGAISRGEYIEPIEVRQGKSGLEITDGHHRYAAYRGMGITDVPVKMKRGGSPGPGLTKEKAKAFLETGAIYGHSLTAAQEKKFRDLLGIDEDEDIEDYVEEDELDEERRGGAIHHRLPRGYTSKNIQSSINFLMARNETLFPGGKHFYHPNAKNGGAWLDQYQNGDEVSTKGFPQEQYKNPKYDYSKYPQRENPIKERIRQLEDPTYGLPPVKIDLTEPMINFPLTYPSTVQNVSSLDVAKPIPWMNKYMKGAEVPRQQVGTSPSGLPVMAVDGNFVRHKFYNDFVAGGNHERYKWVPEGEIWVDKVTTSDPNTLQGTIIHEDKELGLMKKGMSYEKAHPIANKHEMAFEKQVNPEPQMRDGGAWLDQYAEGGPKKKVPDFVTSDKEEYTNRLNAYNDSLNLYKAYQYQKYHTTPDEEFTDALGLSRGQTRRRQENWYNNKEDVNQFSSYTAYEKANKDFHNFTNTPNWVQRSKQEPYKSKFAWTHTAPVFTNSTELNKQDPEAGKIAKYYESLPFNDPTHIAYYTSTDIGHKNIKPTKEYWDGKAWSPVYKKPVQEVLYQEQQLLPLPSYGGKPAPLESQSPSNIVQPIPQQGIYTKDLGNGFESVWQDGKRIQTSRRKQKLGGNISWLDKYK